MIITRRMTFQLTPLLDLLLIVIFAQFMEVQQVSDRTEISHQLQLKEQQTLNQQHIAEFQNQRKQQERQLRAKLSEARDQRTHVGELVAELFNVPQTMVDSALRRRNASAQPLSSQEEQQLRAAFQELADMNGQQVIKHLMTHQELRKRCDVWEIYIKENGSALFITGNEQLEFRFSSMTDFSNKVFQHFRSLPQPKGIVLIILSYGDAKAGIRQIARDALPELTDRMQSSSSGRTRFEYAILGFSPLGSPHRSLLQ
ncbi:MAG: hypothetical protein ABGZ17_25895 [Planctomycetaceae bacterium]